MSVCIAAIGKHRGDSRIIAMTDRKASSTQFSNEDASLKSMWISLKWIAMFAGADISPCVPICRRARQELVGKLMERGDSYGNTVEIVSETFEKIYQQHLSDSATSKVLGRWSLTMKDFLDTGRKKFGADMFDSLCSQIEQVKLQCQFLICGFDGGGEPHVISVRNPGLAENRDTPGYFAIGNGDFAAMSMLGFFMQNTGRDLPTTYYNVCAAKFMAEKASDVGVHPWIWHLSKDGFYDTTPKPYIAALKAWRKRGKPSVPQAILSQLEKYLESEKHPEDVPTTLEALGKHLSGESDSSDVQTSKPAQ